MSALPLPQLSPAEVDLRPVPDRPTTPVGGWGFVALVAALLAIGMGGLLVVNTRIQDQGFQLAQLERERVALSEVQDQLQTQLNDVSSPSALMGAADALGMVPAGDVTQVDISTGTVHGTPAATDPGHYSWLRTDKQVRDAAEARRVAEQRRKEAEAKAAAEKRAAAKKEAEKKAAEKEAAKRKASTAAQQKKATASAPVKPKPKPSAAAAGGEG